jgi:predicted PurR-regulated permease PerM
MLAKFVSVTRATLKGTVFIGTTQGILGGLAFWAVGLDGAIFWGMVMTVLSIIPGVGGALVWVPAAIVLTATGAVWRGIALAGFCSLNRREMFDDHLVARHSQGTLGEGDGADHPRPVGA